jgi:hypothetical protein
MQTQEPDQMCASLMEAAQQSVEHKFLQRSGGLSGDHAATLRALLGAARMHCTKGEPCSNVSGGKGQHREIWMSGDFRPEDHQMVPN